ncbi:MULTISPECIES: hypothetical protein [Enterobacteriaceae]|uniref:hypothetical protein n=1 Tax=Enterobacteriaceae TaxID=543 RepID=UPI000E1C4E3D|nr:MULTISPECIES: hypothetical protein [Enterobacteriaceae]ELK0756157.1 hypothetical protein [Klebsiella oxytoca]HDU3837899.1 hypothetical protein [Klebsiella pneumoniae subsp. pneumoniae]MCX2459994.1 hypothetical protein [Citrobacter freundii complex sp. 2022EL-00972]MDH8387167.1 hypothetical protein [Klebsiella pneumoniae]MDO1953614.1 hypothetical protein [Escherichia coli]
MSEKNFIVDSENMDAPHFLTDKFESDLSSRGFRMDKDKEGFYISELTQSAWLGFSLFYTYMSVEEKRIVDDDRVAADDNVEPATPPALEKNKKQQVFFLDDESDEVDNVCISTSEPIKRSFNKILYALKSDATKQAVAVSKDKCIPMWIHPANGEEGWHISSHGFAISRRPDIPVTVSMLDQRQIFYGFSPSGIAKKMQPSVVARIAYSGSIFTQNSEYFNENILLEWIREQSDPALVISIDKGSRDERSERLTYIQESIKEVLGFSSYYRWITRDTVVIAISHDKFDYGEARERVQNPHWMLKTMSWPNTFILKEMK